MNGMVYLSQMLLMALAISNGLFSSSIAHGPAIKKKLG